jgi:hypothetical protein
VEAERFGIGLPASSFVTGAPQAGVPGVDFRERAAGR